MNKPVDLETAKLLKNNGFNKECSSVYHLNNEVREINILKSRVLTHPEDKQVDYFSLEGVYLRPIIYDVIVWLYEKYGIWIFTLPQDKSFIDFRVENSDYPSLPLFILIIKYEKDSSMKEILNTSDNISEFFIHFDNPTDAYLYAIKFTLKNLKNENL